MKGEFMDAEGAGVKYNDLKKAPIFSEYKKMAASLKTIDFEPLSVDERKVLFLSILLKNIGHIYCSAIVHVTY